MARATADDRSDVDLLVDLAEPRPRGFAYVGLVDGLQTDLERVLGRPVHVVPVHSVEDASSEFRRHIERDAVPL